MGLVLIPVAALYVVLIAFGFKATWRLAVNSILTGSSEIVLPIILFVLMVLVVGPIMGIVNIVKLLIAYAVSPKQNRNSNQQNINS
ncbi:MAG: hypothetical protein AAGU74_04025 [Bacillota bacterium]